MIIVGGFLVKGFPVLVKRETVKSHVFPTVPVDNPCPLAEQREGNGDPLDFTDPNDEIGPCLSISTVKCTKESIQVERDINCIFNQRRFVRGRASRLRLI